MNREFSGFDTKNMLDFGAVSVPMLEPNELVWKKDEELTSESKKNTVD